MWTLMLIALSPWYGGNWSVWSCQSLEAIRLKFLTRHKYQIRWSFVIQILAVGLFLQITVIRGNYIESKLPYAWSALHCSAMFTSPSGSRVYRKLGRKDTFNIWIINNTHYVYIVSVFMLHTFSYNYVSVF